MQAVYLALLNETDMKMTMKKMVLLIALALLTTMCSTSKTTKSTSVIKSKPEIQYKDDFRAASDKEKDALLKDLKAGEANYSILIFTKNFKGENIIVSNSNTTLYKGYPISNLKTGIAYSIRIDNTLNTRVFEKLAKKEIIIDAKEAQKHKYIYMMKNPGADHPYTLTYSNTLRPLE